MVIKQVQNYKKYWLSEPFSLRSAPSFFYRWVNGSDTILQAQSEWVNLILPERYHTALFVVWSRKMRKSSVPSRWIWRALKGASVMAGLTFLSRQTSRPLCWCFPLMDEEGKYEILPFFWIPEENINLRVWIQWKKWYKYCCNYGNIFNKCCLCSLIILTFFNDYKIPMKKISKK